MKNNKERTFYAILGVVLTVILNFSVFSIGSSLWNYLLEKEYSENGHTQLLVLLEDEQLLEDMGPDDSAEYKEKYEKVFSEFKTEVEEYPQVKRVINGYERGRYLYFARIALYDCSDLAGSAADIQKHLQENSTKFAAVSVEADGYVQSHLGQGDSIDRALYNCVVVIVAAIFSAFTILVIRNSMMMAVVERMKDYGMLRCCGMSRKQLYGLLFTEGLMMSLSSLVFGVLFCYAILKLIELPLNHYMRLPLAFHFSFYPTAVIFTALICIATTLFALIEPARQACLLSPVEAISGITVFKNKKGKSMEKIRRRQIVSPR